MRARGGNCARAARSPPAVCSSMSRESCPGSEDSSGKVLDVVRFEILARVAPPQHVPAMVGRNLVQPAREGPLGIVLSEFFAQLHENLDGGVFGILMGRQGPAAKPEDRRGIPAIEISPGFRVTGARPRDRISEFRLSLEDDGLLRRFWLRH